MADDPQRPLKQRDLVFSAEPPGQADRALVLLAGLDDLKVVRGERPNVLRISYSLLDYSLESLERALLSEGFLLDDTTLGQLGKKLIHYQEEVECHNLNVPKRPMVIRRAEIFVKAYDQHLHGDHDDTPPELREYK